MTRNLLKNRFILVALTAIFITAMFTGCKKKVSQPEAQKTSVVTPKPQTQVPKPVLKPVSSALKLPAPPVNQFDFSNKKDPFKPFVIVTAPTDGHKPMREALPIHRFDVSQFKLIGIVTGGKENKAMVTDPNGKGYVLKVGMTIGKNEGRITVITNSGVDVIEQFKDDNGRVRKENIRITLPRKQ